MLRPRRDSGFTLVELTVSVAILGIVMTSITVAVLVAMKSTTEANIALEESADLQFASVYYPNDVQGSNTMASTGTPRCGTGALVIEFVGQGFATDLSPRTRVVSYVTRTSVAPNGSQVLTLHRLSCSTASTSPTYPLTPDEDLTVADDLSVPTPPVAACADAAGANVACSGASAVRASVTLTEASGVVYVLTGMRRTS